MAKRIDQKHSKALLKLWQTNGEEAMEIIFGMLVGLAIAGAMDAFMISTKEEEND